MSLLQGALSEAGQMAATGGRRTRAADSAGGRADPASGGIAARLELALEEERGRWFLWLPVFYGFGIALYLAWPTEPPLLLILAGVVIASATRIFFRSTPLKLVFSAALLMAALGMATAKLHALHTDAPSCNER